MKDNKPFFSIVIPTYNRADFIKTAIISILKQEYKSYEIIVIDDGSTDNTREIIKELNQKTLKYYYQENCERAAARNRGIIEAKGDYVTFLDSDDYFLDQHLFIVYNNLSKNLFPDFFHQDYEIINSSGRVFNYKSRKIITPELTLIKKGNFLSCTGVFVKKSVLVNNLFNEDRQLSGSEDYELWLRLICKHRLFVGIEKTSVLFHHQTRGELEINSNKLITRVNLLINYALNNADFSLKYKKYKSSL